MYETEKEKAEGVIKDDRGKWIKAPVSPKPITKENAREMQQRRYTKQREAAVAGVVAAVQDSGRLPKGVDREAGAYQAILYDIVTEMFDTDNAIAKERLASFIVKVAQWMPEKVSSENSQPVVPIGMAKELVDILRDVIHEKGLGKPEPVVVVDAEFTPSDINEVNE
jgi:hypothetical protein